MSNYNSKDLTGQLFGKLTAVHQLDQRVKGCIFWFCKCECGNTINVRTAALINGHTKSCKCQWGKNGIHNMTGSPEYLCWTKIKSRCYNKCNNRYYTHGARGIIVCESWLNSFENFFNDMGERPSSNHSIDRINNNGNYEPGNCRWATDKEQSNNRRSNVLITYSGQTRNMKQWAEKLGISYSSIRHQMVRSKRTIHEVIQRKNIQLT